MRPSSDIIFYLFFSYITSCGFYLVDASRRKGAGSSAKGYKNLVRQYCGSKFNS